MKIYQQGDECTFSPDTEEYNNLKEFAKMLTENSPNKHKYAVKDVYLDFGQDWKWTTIINETVIHQVLNPKIWLEIVNHDRPFTEIMKDIFESDYCQDKKH